MNLQSLNDILKSNGYKMTSQREAILKIFIKNKNNFISAEKLFTEVKKLQCKTNLSTIYRNLDVLEKLNIVHKTPAKNGNFLYLLVSETSHHHHIICKGCGKSEVLDYCPLNDITNSLKNKNFTLTDHKLELYGYCKDCEKNTKK